MAIPKYNEMYVDYLEALADGQPHKNAEIRATVAAARNLTPEDLALTIPSGRVGLFMDRLSWSGQFLMKAGLTQRTGRKNFPRRQRRDTGEERGYPDRPDVPARPVLPH